MDLRKKITKHIKNDPHGAALFSKLIANPDKKKLNLDNLNFLSISQQTNSVIRNNEDILELFPDTHLASRILRSSILSPNEMITNKLTFTSPDIRLPSAIKLVLTDTIKEYIYSNYDFLDKLDSIIEEALITKGAYIQAIIPEASVDDIIHQRTNNTVFSTESLIPMVEKSIPSNFEINNEAYVEVKVNGNSSKVTQEDLLLNITSNYNILNVRDVALSAMEDFNISRISNNDIFKISNESELDDLFINPNNYKYVKTQEVPNAREATRLSLAKPLVMKLPTDAVIPIHVIGDPSKHIGYFVLLDDFGNPIDYTAMEYSNDAMKQSFLQYESNTGINRFSLVDKAKANLNQQTGRDTILNNLSELYSNIVESMINKRLNMGNIWKLGEIDNVADVYRTMLTRALKNQRTNLLYLPKELVNYFAYEYRDNGTGKSLMEKNSILYSIRAILLFTKLMAQVKNSITNTKVTVNLDEDDPDPEKTIADVTNLAMHSRRTIFPFGVINVKDLSQWAQSLGFYFDFQGEGIPNMKIDFEDTSTNKVVPDTSIDEDIRRMIFMGFGIPPELMDPAIQPEFATTIVSNNILFAKHILQLQKKTNNCLKDLVKKIMINDGVLQAKFKNTIMENMEDIKKHIRAELRLDKEEIETKLTNSSICNYIIKKFIMELEVTLPEPDVSEADNLNKALDSYKSRLESYLDLILDSNILSDKYVGKFSGEIDGVKGLIKSLLIKKWAEENGFLPEVSEILTKDIDDKPFIDLNDELSSYVNSLAEFVVPIFKTIDKEKTNLDKKMDKFFKLEGEAGDLDSSSDTGEDEGGSDDTGDLGDSMDTFEDEGMDFGDEDTGGEENPEDNQEENNQPEDNKDESNNDQNDQKEDTSKQEENTDNNQQQ